MRKMRGILVVMMGLVLLLTNCSNPGTLVTKISKCDAVKIARKQVPTRIADSTVATGLRYELGTYGTWWVIFPYVNTTPEEIGWIENENTHFNSGDDEPWNENQPKNIYRNVTIYIDAETGNVTSRELNNEMFTGGIGSFPDCD